MLHGLVLRQAVPEGRQDEAQEVLQEAEEEEDGADNLLFQRR